MKLNALKKVLTKESTVTTTKSIDTLSTTAESESEKTNAASKLHNAKPKEKKREISYQATATYLSLK